MFKLKCAHRQNYFETKIRFEANSQLIWMWTTENLPVMGKLAIFECHSQCVQGYGECVIIQKQNWQRPLICHIISTYVSHESNTGNLILTNLVDFFSPVLPLRGIKLRCSRWVQGLNGHKHTYETLAARKCSCFRKFNV